jgi:hypothetical protein
MSQLADVIGPDEAAVRAHLRSAPFRAGVLARRWRLVELEWPYAVIAIAAAPRKNSPDEFALRFDLSGYLTQAPTEMPWDIESGCQLDLVKYPKGDRVSEVFRTDWEQGRALYAGYDRVAANGHPNWRIELPRSFWNPTRDLTWVLSKISDLLTSEDYRGV